jgi:hypothetical protein
MELEMFEHVFLPLRSAFAFRRPERAIAGFILPNACRERQ